MKKLQYYKIKNGKIHIIRQDYYYYHCGLRWEYVDVKLSHPNSSRLKYQLCKKCAKAAAKIISGQTIENILPNKLFEI